MCWTGTAACVCVCVFSFRIISNEGNVLQLTWNNHIQSVHIPSSSQIYTTVCCGSRVTSGSVVASSPCFQVHHHSRLEWLGRAIGSCWQNQMINQEWSQTYSHFKLQTDIQRIKVIYPCFTDGPKLWQNRIEIQNLQLHACVPKQVL